MRPVEEFMMCDRLSPDLAERKFQFKKMPLPVPGVLNGWNQEGVKLFAAMVENPVDVPDYSFTEHQAKAKACRFDPNHPDWPKPRGGKTIHPLLDKPYYLRGKFGVCGAWVFPNFLAQASLANLNDSTKRLAKFDFAPKKTRGCTKSKGNLSETNVATDGAAAQGTQETEFEHDQVAMAEAHQGKTENSNTPAGQHVLKRHMFDIDRPDLGHCGVKHYVRCWHATGMEFFKSIEPSRDLLKNNSNLELSRRLSMLSECFHVDVRVMALIKLGFPELHRLMQDADEKLKDYLAVDMLSNVWHNSFFGRAIVYNRQTGVHLDVKGVSGGMDVLIAGGHFTGGELVLHDMNVTIPFLPGTLVAFDGTAQRHSISTFEGSLRYSHVYFLHQSVFDELEIDTRLPALTEQSMRASLKAARPKGPPNRVRRQHHGSKQTNQPPPPSLKFSKRPRID